MLHTRFTELFGLDYPVMSAPMAMHSGGSVPPGAPVYFGQSAGFVDRVRPAAHVVRSISDDAERVLRDRPSTLMGD